VKLVNMMTIRSSSISAEAHLSSGHVCHLAPYAGSTAPIALLFEAIDRKDKKRDDYPPAPQRNWEFAGCVM
jgi:hypothetical protein